MFQVGSGLKVRGYWVWIQLPDMLKRKGAGTNLSAFPGGLGTSDLEWSTVLKEQRARTNRGPKVT